jgi:hypothetical protein
MTTRTTPTDLSKAGYIHLGDVLAGGDISKTTKAELERFAVMLARPNAYGHLEHPVILRSVKPSELS